MTRDDLKPGYVVKFRNGNYAMVLLFGTGNLCAVTACRTWMNIFGEIREDLTSKCGYDDCDITEVYGYDEYAYKSRDIDIENRPLLWKRSEPKKMTVKEICETLGYDVEIVKEAPNA